MKYAGTEKTMKALTRAAGSARPGSAEYFPSRFLASRYTVTTIRADITAASKPVIVMSGNKNNFAVTDVKSDGPKGYWTISPRPEVNTGSCSWIDRNSISI